MTALFLMVACLAAPDVVLISVDTLRADHLGCYGHSLDSSPNIDSLARQSLVFDDCVCEVPLTNPSFAAMLTSRYPRMTGATRNGIPISSSVPTITEVFKAAGYQTFCVQSNWTLKAKLSGLGRGFDIYDDDFYTRRWGFIKSERYADEVADIAIEKLRDRDPLRPLFCWIHFSDPHAPYRFHRKFNPAGKRWRRGDRAAKAGAKYDSEVAFADYHIGRILEVVPLENTFVMFVADHGESLYEHDYIGHGRRIYQASMRIPLMISGPGIAPGRTDVPARGIDIGPTLLGFARLKGLPGMLGVDLLEETPMTPRPRVVETYGWAVLRLPGARSLLAGRGPDYQGVLTEGWKLILNDEKAELFHIRNDPMEEHDLADTAPERLAALKNLIAEWEHAFPRAQEEEAALSEDDLRVLESLGYME